MACQGEEIADVPVLFGCPGNDEYILVWNAEGGQGVNRYAKRKWSAIKGCITGTVKTPYIGVVDRGQTDPTKDPVSGQSILQDDSLIGLGADNGGNIQMVIDDVLMSNFGINASFIYDANAGQIDLNYNGSGNTFVSGSGVFIDRNQ